MAACGLNICTIPTCSPTIDTGVVTPGWYSEIKYKKPTETYPQAHHVIDSKGLTVCEDWREKGKRLVGYHDYQLPFSFMALVGALRASENVRCATLARDVLETTNCFPIVLARLVKDYLCFEVRDQTPWDTANQKEKTIKVSVQPELIGVRASDQAAENSSLISAMNRLIDTNFACLLGTARIVSSSESSNTL